MSEFWHSSLQDTLEKCRRMAPSSFRQSDDVADWLSNYAEAAPTSSNQGTANVAFQRWFHFKEAFSPKFVADTLTSLPYKVSKCLDPFGGSGTTAVTCRMLGIEAATIEVNPFLADLIDAKLSAINAAEFCRAYEYLIDTLVLTDADHALPDGIPLTMSQPGRNGRYVFSAEVYATIRGIVRSSASLPPEQARLLKVLLGSVLVANSNVTINGKGRRYRKSWEARPKSSADLIGSLDHAVDLAAEDLIRFSSIRQLNHSVFRGDARVALANVHSADVAIFSPPYPNSFDYTDVYNLELWMLGYLGNSGDNRSLRQRTLRSHVQLKWNNTEQRANSKHLIETVEALKAVRAELWNVNIPEMIGFYFDDLLSIFQQLSRILKPGHHAVVAIGDSQYAGVHIDVGSILSECISDIGFRLTQKGAIRSMRNSSQHGGTLELSEHCLIFERT